VFVVAAAMNLVAALAAPFILRPLRRWHTASMIATTAASRGALRA